MQIAEELISLGKIACDIIIISLISQFKSIISMLFLGYLGDIELAGGSLSAGVANITGYSIVKGLAMGMEPICSQAYGAQKLTVFRQIYKKTLRLILVAGELEVLALTSAALPIVGICELGNSPQTASCGILTGSARPRSGACINFVLST
ncbi:hypothetical protein LWI28_005929 [Acer negundo]|uniref:Uncharacterized protein n=1 Tax=Acer negundo TaxID=4023 RepID=A0AAD5I9C0_ACENE|nr:hypothetical protein LWI28_005929 [Acer negundo]